MMERKSTGPTGKRVPTGDYPVGKYRPPVDHQWKAGQSGNPKGRPKGRCNFKTELEKIASKAVTVRDGDKEQKYSMLGANALAHGVKGAKGDARSAGLFLNYTHKVGLLEDDDTVVQGQGAGPLMARAAQLSSPSEALFAGLDIDSLSRDDQVELSRLAEIIDTGGHITALSTADFERAKDIINKGRGKDITIQ